MRGNMRAESFNEGIDYRAYRYLGCHRTDGGYVFRTWAPTAKRAFVVGSFNGWSDGIPMTRLGQDGLWEGFVPEENITPGDLYKFKFESSRGAFYKADPFASYSGVWPESASRVFALGGHEWKDSCWMADRKRRFSGAEARKQPVSIYEVHLPSWKKRRDGSVLSYRELADSLAPYMLQMGYTHVELIEPFEQVEGVKSCFYALSALHGSPEDFLEFVDMMHRAGLGVILDWDISKYSLCDHGIAGFDSDFCGVSRKESKLGRFDYSSRSSQSFLISNAVYLADVFHIDGIRLESISDIVYRRGRIPDRGAVSLIRRICGVMRDYYPDCMMMTDELGGVSGVTSNAANGLGFTFKWDGVCTRDTLAYSSVELSERARHTSELSAPLKHAFGEASVLTLSHYDVMGSEQSFISRMPGSYDEKFAGCRTFLTYMMTRPGKKLRFMGSEIGQFDGWDPFGEVEWFLLDYEKHARLQLYLAKLGELYLKTPALWELDCEPRGFSLDCAQGGVFAYRRFDSKGGEVAVVLNFTPYRICKYSLGVKNGGSWREVLSSDGAEFGGGGAENSELVATPVRGFGTPYSLSVDLPPLGAVVLEYTE